MCIRDEECIRKYTGRRKAGGDKERAET